MMRVPGIAKKPLSPVNQGNQALQFLTKVSKGIKGTFNVLTVQEAFKMLPGWDLDPVVTADIIKSFWETPAFQALNLQASDRFDPFSVNDFGYWVYPTEQETEVGRALFQRTCDLVGKDGPSNPVVGRIYYTKLLPVAPAEELPYPRVQNKGMSQFGASRFWLGVEGWKVTAPNGKTLEFNQPLTLRRPSNEYSVASFWAFVYANGLDKAAKAVLKAMDAEAVEKAVHPTSYRSLENTGTCPVCFANVKLINDRISRHGWQVQGKRQRGVLWTTMHTGPCFGYQYEPFEISPRGSEAYLAKVLEPTLQRKQDDLEQLKRKPAESYRVKNLWREEKEVLKGSEGYEKHWNILVIQLEQVISWLKSDIKEMQAKITSWKPQSLPGMKKAAVERLARRYLSH